MKKTNIAHITNIILLCLSLLTIFLFSSEKGVSSKNTSTTVAKEIISVVIKEENENHKKVATFVDDNIAIIRKLAHVVEFFILGFFLSNILKDYKNISKTTILISVIIAFLYACTDEIHQMFVAGRSARLFDILVDSFGAFLGSEFYYLIYTNSKRKKIVKK